MVSFTLSLRAELRHTGVRPLALCPSGIVNHDPIALRKQRNMGPLARLAGLSPEEIARIALREAERGRSVVVPGWPNRVLKWIAGVVPRSLTAQIVERTIGRA